MHILINNATLKNIQPSFEKQFSFAAFKWISHNETHNKILGTTLNSMKSISETEIGDINKARVTFRSLINADPTNPQGWIAAARLEEQAGNIVNLLLFRKIDGCKKAH